MTNAFWNIKYCELWNQSEWQRTKILDLPKESILLGTGRQLNGYTQVVFVASRDYKGWVKTEYLDPIEYALPNNVVALENQTFSEQDAKQNIQVAEGIWFNLCGEMCVSFVMDEDLKDFLARWKAHPLSFYNRILLKGLSKPTTIPDLKNMVAAYPNATFASLDVFEVDDRIIMTPKRIKAVLDDGWKIIVGVRINFKGVLKPIGIGHWITIMQSVPNGVNSGWLNIYNPYPNNIQAVSWDELSSAMGAPYGLLVKA